MAIKIKHIRYIILTYPLLKAKLSDKERIVLANIVSVIQGGGEYWFKNDFIADYLNCHENSVSRIINQLISKGFIERTIIREKGSNQIVKRKLTLTKFSANHFVNLEEYLKVKDNSNTLDNTVPNTISNTQPSNNKTNINQKLVFKKFWDLYDYKKAKIKAERAWNKIPESLYSTIIAYVPDYVENTNTNGEFPARKYPATFLNDRTWEDELTISSDILDEEWEKQMRESEGLTDADMYGISPCDEEYYV
jgi:DNA-binding MarR family transcriptional regulator